MKLEMKVEATVEAPLRGSAMWEMDDAGVLTIAYRIEAGPAVLRAMAKGDATIAHALTSETTNALNAVLAKQRAAQAAAAAGGPRHALAETPVARAAEPVTGLAAPEAADEPLAHVSHFDALRASVEHLRKRGALN